ncbi:MAG: class I SAM-dependent methyltransferase [Candidatus Pacearchaeota archaeon]
MKPLIEKVKKKKEFSKIPNTLVERALILSKNDFKKARALLRKYFGVFLTNKVLKLEDEKILKNHISSKSRNYEDFYKKIFEKEKNFKFVLDIGCGVNGFSYCFLKNILGDVNYLGFEAVGQIVEKSNEFFKKRNFEKAEVYQIDIFDIPSLEAFFKIAESPKVFFLFQIIDALEAFERDSSKRLLLSIRESLKEEDLIIITMSTKSLSGKKKFEVKREWLKYFLNENFEVEDFFFGNEKVFRCRLK